MAVLSEVANKLGEEITGIQHGCSLVFSFQFSGGRDPGLPRRKSIDPRDCLAVSHRVVIRGCSQIQDADATRVFPPRHSGVVLLTKQFTDVLECNPGAKHRVTHV